MTAVQRGAIHLVLAAVLACAGGWAAVRGLTTWREHQIASGPSQTLPPPGTRVQKAIDAIREDGVYVAPDGRSMVDRAGERKIEKAVAGTDRPVHVIVWATSTQDGDWLRADDQLKREFAGEDALVYIWEGPEAGDVVEVGRTLDYYGTPGEDHALSYITDFVGDPATKLSEAALATKGVPWDSRGGELTNEPASRGGLVTAGVFVGALVAAGLIAAIWTAMFLVSRSGGGRRRIPGRWTWTEGNRGG